MEHDEVAHGEIGTGALVGVDERIGLLGSPREMRAPFVESDDDLIKLPVGLCTLGGKRGADGRYIDFVVKVAEEDVLASNLDVRYALAGVLINQLATRWESLST